MIRCIAEVIVLFQKRGCCLMILVTGHNIKRNVYSGFLHDIHQIFNKTLEDINLLCETNIKHSLWIIGSQPGPHSTCKQYRANLALTDRL